MTLTLHRVACPALMLALVSNLMGCSKADPEAWLSSQAYEITARYKLEDIPQDASGLSYDPYRKGLWLVSDDPPTLYFVTTEGIVTQKIKLQGFDDPEAVTWIAGNPEGQSQLVISEERRARLTTINTTQHSESIHYSAASLRLQMDKQGSNNGIEGLGYQADEDRLWFATEHHPQAVYNLQDNKLNHSWSSPLWQTPWDYSGLEYVPASRSLLVLSDRNQRLTEYDLQGRERARLKISNIPNPEGIALAPDGRLYICSEPNLLFTLSPALQLHQ